MQLIQEYRMKQQVCLVLTINMLSYHLDFVWFIDTKLFLTICVPLCVTPLKLFLSWTLIGARSCLWPSTVGPTTSLVLLHFVNVSIIVSIQPVKEHSALNWKKYGKLKYQLYVARQSMKNVVQKLYGPRTFTITCSFLLVYCLCSWFNI